MADTLKLEIVTPEKKVYSESVSSVVVPAVQGEMDILPKHVPLLTMIEPGDLRVTKDGQVIDLAVGEGFVEITGTDVIVLTDMALREEEIDENAAEEAVKRAEIALKEEASADSEQHAALMATLQKSLAQIKVKRRGRG